MTLQRISTLCGKLDITPWKLLNVLVLVLLLLLLTYIAQIDLQPAGSDSGVRPSPAEVPTGSVAAPARD